LDVITAIRNGNEGEAVSRSEETPMKVARPKGRF